MDCGCTPCKNVQTKMSCSVDKFSVLKNCILLKGYNITVAYSGKAHIPKNEPYSLANINDITLALEPV